MNYETTFLKALVVTVVVECVVIVALLRLLPAAQGYAMRFAKVIAAGTLPSIATLPYLWFVVPALLHPYFMQVIVGELAVFAVEIVIIRVVVNLPLRWCTLMSFAANAASIVVGLAVFR